ncbi:MAG TPA: DUF4012 domain-containing protein [Actinomycetota bacterium]|jgi:hypothetical protein|nr:DUF4012 domain-containing protein [Actinomycetota bacterium]
MTLGGPEAARPPPRRFWPRAVKILLALILLAIVGTAALGISLLQAADPLRDGRTALERGRSALASGDLDRALTAFAEARDAFARAEDATGGLAWRLASWFPILGRNADVARSLAHAGSNLTAAGNRLTDAAAALPEGFGSLAPHRGAVPVDTLSGLSDDLEAAADLATGAAEELKAAPRTLLLPPVDDARVVASDAADQAAGTLSTARVLAQALPSFLGSDGPRRYFFGAQNPAELRGTGGLLGAFAIATIENGSISFSPFRPTQSLQDFPPGAIPAPNPDYGANYDQYGGAGDWQSLNMTPDFPSAARAIQASYERATGERVDGVILADPFALRDLLEVTGGTEVPLLGVRIEAGNVVPFVTNEAYDLFRTSAERKEVLGAVASGVFERFLADEGRGISRVRAIVTAASGGHLLIYSDDRATQTAVETAGISGALAAPPGDALAVVVNSASGSKIDYYATRSIDYQVELEPGGAANGTAAVTIHNAAPTSGLPAYVIGPFPGVGEAGDNISLVSVFCAPGCQGYAPEENGNPVPVRVGKELGFSWYQDFPTIPSEESTEFSLRTALTNVWQGDATGGTYRLTFLGQPTILPTSLRVELTVPTGMHVTSTSVPMEISGDTAVWEGQPGRTLQIEASFEAPLTTQVWRSLTDWLG